jgi:hypothetical protein
VDSVDTVDTEPQPAAAEPETPAARRWFQRVLPVTGLALLLVALAALIVPAFRDQLKLSISRQAQPYVELYFARRVGPVAQVVCLRQGSTVGVRFVIASHLHESRTVAYRVTVDPATKGRRTLHKTGSTHTTPDTPREVGKAFRLPRRPAYTLTVSLPALDQQLRAHCPGARS